MSKELQDYILQARNSGKSDEQIMKELLSAGWSASIISKYFAQENFPDAPSPTSVSSTSPKQIFSVLGRIALLFVLPILMLFVLLATGNCSLDGCSGPKSIYEGYFRFGFNFFFLALIFIILVSLLFQLIFKKEDPYWFMSGTYKTKAFLIFISFVLIPTYILAQKYDRRPDVKISQKEYPKINQAAIEKYNKVSSMSVILLVSPKYDPSVPNYAEKQDAVNRKVIYDIATKEDLENLTGGIRVYYPLHKQSTDPKPSFRVTIWDPKVLQKVHDHPNVYKLIYLGPPYSDAQDEAENYALTPPFAD